MFLKNIFININVSVLLCLIIVLLSPDSVYSQDSLVTAKPEKHSLYKGSKAIQFKIAYDLTLTNFDGLAFSGKKHISDKSAIRIGFDIMLAISHSDSRTESYSTSHHNTDQERIELNALYMRYLSLDKMFKFYWAAGPSVLYDREYSKGWNNSYGMAHIKDTDALLLLGGLMAFGTEWFAAKNLGIHAEYGLKIYYRHRIDQRYTSSNSSSGYYKNRYFTGYLESTNVNFGLSVYF